MKRLTYAEFLPSTSCMEEVSLTAWCFQPEPMFGLRRQRYTEFMYVHAVGQIVLRSEGTLANQPEIQAFLTEHSDYFINS